jgi:glucoamylase
VDPSFLEGVRLGVKSALDPNVLSSLPVVDRELRYQTSNGPFWHRASFDGYGEQRDGSQWEPVDPGSGQTLGRGWPLLTGERGENTFSATPLAWSHAQFIRLARSIDAGRSVETPAVVACRYHTTLCP